jgi:hypothetical protein
MKPLRVFLFSSLAATTLIAQPSYVGPAPVPTIVNQAADRRAAYVARINEALTWRANFVPPAEPEKIGLADIAAKLALRQDTALCSTRLIELMKTPSGDMFWMFPVTCISYLGRDQLSPAAKAAVREAWRVYMPLRGDTENHWAMYYTSLYLMAQLWPNEPGDRWFTGKSTDENLRESREYLIHWMGLTTTIGQGEYDCTEYLGEYTIPMLFLAAWAEDPVMRQRGRMMLEYVLADFAVETLNGLYIGSHARTTDIAVTEKWNALSSTLAWLFFGNCPPISAYSWGLYVAAAGASFDLPEIIYRIAVDRPASYTHYERKRTRHRWRNSDVRNAPVYKTTYVTRDYAIGSDQGGLLQPIQQHSWDVTWAVDDPRGKRNTLFSLQAHYGTHELMMYFTEMPDYMPASVTFQGKPSYISEWKLLGGSPHEQLFQQDDCLIQLTDVPAGETLEHINGFFSGDLAKLEEDKTSGWIFAQGGRAFIAYRPLTSYEWRPIDGGDKRLLSPARQNGTIVQVASASEFKSWDDFKTAITKLPLEFKLAPKPAVTFATLRGRKLETAYGAAPRVDGRTIDYAKEWKLFRGPYLNAEVGSGTLTMTHGKLKRVLDFNTLTITDAVVP